MNGLEELPTGLKTVISEPDGGVKVDVFYLECLAQASYLVSHEGKAFMIDPRRDIDSFLRVLQSEGLTLLGILETHFHADFVSGHNEFHRRTGAPIYFGPSAGKRCKFPVHELKDNEEIEFSSHYVIRALHTPGHTMESVVYVIVDKTQDNRPLKAFTGDTLFIGSCGRPDLVGSVGFSADEMSRHMFNTLQNKIKTLPDDVQVFPAHGAGSPCGKNISKDLYSTIGKEKATNKALSFTDEQAFVSFLTSGQPTSPSYFSYNVKLNTEGACVLSEELAGIPKLSPQDFNAKLASETCTVIDTRNIGGYCKCHVVDALNFPLGGAGGTVVTAEDGNFAMWVGTCLSSDIPLLLVNAPGKDSEAVQRLARIGYTNIKGVLLGGMDAYANAGYATASRQRINLSSGPSLADYLAQDYKLLDVRTEGEFEGNCVPESANIPLAHLNTLKDKLNRDTSYIVYCLSGFRSTIAASILDRDGFKVQDLNKGFAAISYYAPELTSSKKTCPTMKSLMEAISG